MTMATRFLPQIARATLVVAAALGAGCESPVEPASQRGAPAALEFSIGGFGVGMRGVKLRGDTILVLRMAWDQLAADTTKVVPAEADWDAFWAAAQLAGVHRWRSTYSAPDILDGTGWSLTLRSGRLRVASSGSNAYPTSLGGAHRGDYSAAFRLFLDGLGALTGGEF